MGIDHCMKMVYPVMMKEGEPMGYHIKKDFHLKNPSLLKFTVSWFSMLLIPAVMGISIYLLVLENNSRQLDEYNYQMIRTASEDLERSLCAADDFADTLNMVETLFRSHGSPDRYIRSGSRYCGVIPFQGSRYQRTD